MQQGQQQFAMEQAVQKMQRERGLRDILTGAYVPPQPASENYLAASPAMGAVQPGEYPLPNYPQQGTPAEPSGRMDMQKAIGLMAKGGYGAEAMKMQAQQAKLAGATPSMVNEYKFWTQLPEADKENYLAVKRAQQIKKIGGVETVVSPISGTKPLGTLEQETDAKREFKKAEGLGGQSAKLSGEAFKHYEKINKNIINLKEAVRLVEAGAETGAISARFPSFRSASVELDNMRNRLGLDIIGAVTFGALSQGELDLALNTALPTKLNGEPLVAWANKKIVAQQKLANYFSEQAIYLGKQGSTPSGWLEMQKAKKPQTTAPQTEAEYNALPSGAIYIDPDDGKKYRKP